MSHDAASAVTRIDGAGARGGHAPEPTAHERRHATGRHAALQAVESAQRSTELAFQVDVDAHRILVQVIDSKTRAVVRSFPLLLPGVGSKSEHDPPRGALVDAKA